MAESSKPYAPPVGGTNGTPWDEPLHRELWGASLGDGILGDAAGNAFNASVVAGPQIRITAGRASVRGHRYLGDVTINLPVTAVSGSSNARIDQAVLHFDPTQTTPGTKIRMKTIEGVVGTSPTAPALTRAEGSGWMLPLWQWRVTSTGVSGPLVDLRSWVGPHLVVASAASLPSDAPLGATATELSGARWWRSLVAGTPMWISDSPRASAHLTSDIEPGTGARTTLMSLTSDSLVGGMAMPTASRIAVPAAASYRVDAQVRVASPAAAPSIDATSMVRLNSGGNPAGGSLVAASYDFVPAGHNVTVSLIRADVPLTAGSYLEWFVTTSNGGGGLALANGPEFTSITVERRG